MGRSTWVPTPRALGTPGHMLFGGKKQISRLLLYPVWAPLHSHPQEDKDASACGAVGVAEGVAGKLRALSYIVETQNHGSGSNHRIPSSFSPQNASGILIYLLA